jgi:hypothetical protein
VVGTPVLGSPNQTGFHDPSKALGAPTGRGNQGTGGEGSTDVYNLGVGGSITLGFDDGATPRAIANGSGADFIVFENAFYAGGNPSASFAELVFVEVSTNGQQFARFPNNSTTPPPAPGGFYNTIDPANVSGFAGVHPVFANANDPNAPSPFDPAAPAATRSTSRCSPTTRSCSRACSTCGNVRFVRLVDVRGDGTDTDTSGDPIYDPSGPIVGGADIDAVAVINGVPEPAGTAMLAAAMGACLFPRGRRR